ncbi:MAG: hypothetical protein R3A13_10840 [Bdellovibrionota bacterium]
MKTLLFIAFSLLCVPSLVFAELRVLDESGLTRAIHFTTEPASIKINISSNDTNNIHVKLVNVDGLAADIESIYYDEELVIPEVSQGSWQISLQPKSAVITSVKIEAEKY